MYFEFEFCDLKFFVRVGKFYIDYGMIEMLIFMFVGMQGIVKGVYQQELWEDVEVQIIFGNIYYLYMCLGMEVMEVVGGLYQFMNWECFILMDSGGYQVYLFLGLRKIVEEGVCFQLYINGSYYFFFFEFVMDVQCIIGVDIIMVFDECMFYLCDYEYVCCFMYMIYCWLKCCIVCFEGIEFKYGYQQVFFFIVQGSVYFDL